MAEGFTISADRKRGQVYFKLYIDIINKVYVIACEDHIKPGFLEFNASEDVCFRGKAAAFNYFMDNIASCKYFWKQQFGSLDGFKIDYNIPELEV